jgi:hypothetical protein
VVEAQSPRVDVDGQRGLVHQKSHGVVGHQDALGLLKNAAGRATAMRDKAVNLMGIELVVTDFEFPALMVEHHPLGGRQAADSPAVSTGVGENRPYRFR